mmetsp:Transcript_5364/g.11784  ORF Transcript_5364/g.11784 Transcript_5364/m.11784 type:complete len:323 (-) Transcript_5364:79-1047(-)
MKFFLASTLLICAANAFTLPKHSIIPASNTRLHAADGPPQYDKIEATLRRAEKVDNGHGSSVMLHIDTRTAIEYEPGHVIALEIKNAEDDTLDADSKTFQDAQANGGWMRGPYTVSRSTEHSLDVMMKVVGEKSKRFASAEAGTPVRFGGKFKVPILEGISNDTTKRVVFVSTGVGVGPCIGAIEKALSGEGSSFPPIDLIASYRTEEEVVSKEHLDRLQIEHPDKFSWKTIVTKEQGRLSSSDNLKELTSTKFHCEFDNTHYHLIGNGQMVSEFKQGLQKAGVSDDKVTVEMYFNHKADVDAEAVERIAAAVMETAPASVV